MIFLRYIGRMDGGRRMMAAEIRRRIRTSGAGRRRRQRRRPWLRGTTMRIAFSRRSVRPFAVAAVAALVVPPPSCVGSRGGTRDSRSRLPPMRFLLLLLNRPTIVRGNLCVGRIGNPIIIIFLVLVYSLTMRGVVNHVSPRFCPTCVAAGLTLRPNPHGLPVKVGY